MANHKYHWAIKVGNPRQHRNAWKPGWGGYCVQACGRKYVSTAFPDSAADFVNRAKCNPDWHCSDCATQARLALAKESAPKPDSRTDSDRYAELRKLVEAWQQWQREPRYDPDNAPERLLEWSHR